MAGSCSDRKKKGVVRLRRGSGKRQSRAALTGGGENNAAQRQCGRWRLASTQVAGRGGGGV
jgi:hypothetical protein